MQLKLCYPFSSLFIRTVEDDHAVYHISHHELVISFTRGLFAL